MSAGRRGRPVHLRTRDPVSLRNFSLGTLAALSQLFFAAPAAAQDPFELQVYTPTTAERGEWELELMANHVARGSSAFDGALAPSDGQTRAAVELTHGFTDRFEVSAYALAAFRPDANGQWAGWRFRARVRAPEAWRLPVQLGLSAELEHTRPAFAEHEDAVEIVPIVGWSRGRFSAALNFPLERGIGSGAEGEWEFEPSARADLAVSRSFTLSTEYFEHFIFPGATVRLGDDLTWTSGVGFGLEGAADELVLKTAFEFPLHE